MDPVLGYTPDLVRVFPLHPDPLSAVPCSNGMTGSGHLVYTSDSKQFTTGEFFLYAIPASVILMVLVGFAAYVLWPIMGMPVTIPAP